MSTFFGTLSVLILAVGSPFLFTWIKEMLQKRIIQKMNKRLEHFEKYLKESGNSVEADHNYMQTN